jgi:hypothetical protein
MIRSALFSVLSDIGTPSSLAVQQIADQRRAISALGVGLAPSATESPLEEPGSIPVGAIVETGTAWGVPAAVEPAVLFLPADAARHLVGISVGIGSHRR